MNEYKVVRTSSLDKLEVLVNELMQEGWEPTGGVARTGAAYMQALTRFTFSPPPMSLLNNEATGNPVGDEDAKTDQPDDALPTETTTSPDTEEQADS